MRRRVTTESRVIASASRPYPNSVGAALGDRRRHQTRPFNRRRIRSWSEKKCAVGTGGKKPTKGKRNVGVTPDLDADADAE